MTNIVNSETVIASQASMHYIMNRGKRLNRTKPTFSLSVASSPNNRKSEAEKHHLNIRKDLKSNMGRRLGVWVNWWEIKRSSTKGRKW